MFEVGFSELLMVALVALLVVGPERLPKVARVTGLWLGRARNMMTTVKAEIQAELHAEEMRQLIKEQASLNELHALESELTNASANFKTELNQSVAETVKQVKGHEAD